MNERTLFRSQIIVLNLLVLAAISVRLNAASPVVISEFMAANASTIADEDGVFEDWIEVHNTSPSAVSLLNWSLTDDPALPDKWRFPATNLNAGAYLVVFASGQDRRTPGATLHTNFKLSSSGEYLALLEPDGTNIATEFSPTFLPQVSDVSYGLDPGLRITTLLAANAVGKIFVPTDDSFGTNWILPGFNDASWRTATSGVGFAVGALDNIPVPGLTNHLAGYWKFDETNGLVARDSSGRGSNGTLVSFPANSSQWIAGRNDGGLKFRGSPNSDHVRVSNYPKATNALTVSAWVLAEGRPTWASIAKNWGSGMQGQFHFGLRDTAGDLDVFIHTAAGDFNVREGTQFPTGQWQHVAFTAEGGTLRLFRNAVLVGSGPYSGNFVNPPMSALGIGVKLNDAGSAADASAPGYWQGKMDDLALWNRALTTNEIQAIATAGGPSGTFIATDLRRTMRGSNATCYLRFPFVVTNPDLLTRWRLRMRYDDGFAAWLNGEEIVRRNAPDPLAWDATATNERTAEDAAQFEEFNLAAFTSFVVPGANVLAIQGLNASKDDTDFLIQPWLEASSITNSTNALVYFTRPTPHTENVVGVSVLGPILKDLAHTPAVPLDHENLLVTVKVAPAFAPVTNVTLRYRVMFSNEVAAPMFDDGAHGDGAAGDLLYGAIIPPSASNPGQMVRYFVTAADSLGRTNREPLFADPTGSAQYRGTMVQTLAVTSALPVIHWFVATPGLAETDAGTRCSFFGYNGEFFDNVFIRIRGGTARGWPKKSYKIELNEGEHFLIHPEGRRVSEFDLNATYTDKAYVRAVLTYEHQRDAGHPSPDSFHVHLRQNNAFYSVTIFVEQPDRDFLRRWGLDENGALYKCGPGSTYDTVTAFEKKTRRTEDKSDAQALLTGLTRTGTALENFVFDNLDLPGQINFLATVAITQNIDGSDKNHFLYRDTEGTGEWRMLPWDLDLTFGPDALNTDTIVSSLQNTNAPACASHPFISARPYLLHAGKYNRLIEAIVNTPRTRQMLLRRTRTLTDEFLATRYFQDRLEQLYPMLNADVQLDRARWGVNAHFGGANPTFRQALDRIKNEYLTPRLPYLTGTNIAGVGSANPLRQPLNALVQIAAVEFNPASGDQRQEYVCLTNTSPFPVDLSGWRVTGGIEFAFKPGTVIPTNGVLYLSPEVAAFRARLSGPRGGQGLFVQGNYQGQLSARGETLQITDPFGRVVQSQSYPGASSAAQQYLRITEIMYHPAPFVVPALAGKAEPAAAGTTSGPEEFEFIELKNISTNVPLDLTNVRFAHGIDFNFTGSAVTSLAPGATVLVVKNETAFAAAYGTGFNIAGSYVGSLENGGERIQLVDASGEEILDFSYDNNWYPISDGLGFSLVLVNENAEPDAWNSRFHWRASGQLGGSPADTDPAPPGIVPIVISEALTRTDTPPLTDSVELFNPTANPADISGWFLTDDFNAPKKFRIPPGTMIPAGGFVVFREVDFNPGGTGFAFGSDGDEAWLFSADSNGNLSGYVQGFDFGAALDGVSFGRYVTSVGEEHFVAQAAPTLGTPNAGPKIGPLIISEIMYRPAESETTNTSIDEFIELQNIVADFGLYDPLRPSNTWKITGGVEFEFPALTELVTGQILLLVNFNPATNSSALAAFRAKYDVPDTVKLFGPYRGQLNNGNDEIELRMPTTPLGSKVPYVLVDKVRYRDSAPWPAGADGFGLSLQRRAGSNYGNDPTNWVASLPTAGRSPALIGTPPVITSQPLSQTVVAYGSATLSVTATGSAALHYQWRVNGANVSGATNALLQWSNVQPHDVGDYQVVVFNQGGSVVSSNATLHVLLPPSILQPPASKTTFPLSNVTFTVAAFSGTPLRYRWQFNGADLLGATNAAYSINSVQPTHEGEYTVVVTDSVGSIVSDVARLTVLTHPLFTQQPTNRTAILGPIPTNLTLVSAAISSTPVRYQWRFNGSDLPGATAASLTLSNVQPAQAGIYTVVASDDYGSITSSPAVVTVLIRPVITLQPISQSVVSNGTATFTIAASGTTPIGFRWRKNNLALNNALLAVTPSNSTLILTNLKSSDAAFYNVAVTNIAGPASSLSSNAVLTVLDDSDGDGIPDALEPLDGAGDTDGDGMSNAAEYFAGTDYLDPTSYLKVEIAAPVGATLRFNAISNRTYTLQYTDGLHPVSWRKFLDVLARTNSRLETLTDPTSGSQRYYRLVTPTQP